MHSQLLALYFLPILFGIVAFVFGFCAAFYPRWFGAEIDTSGRTALRIIGVALMPFGVLFIYFIVSGPSPSDRMQSVASVLEAEPADVTSVAIRPVVDRSYAKKNLLQAEALISDPASLEQICEALNQAESWHPNHPETIWVCELVLKKEVKSRRCLVKKTTNNGVLISFSSASEGGGTWNIGSFRSDTLGPLLESLAQKQR